MNLKRIIREEMDNSLGWINDIKPALNEDQEWIVVNDVNPSSVEEGIKIQKYLFNLGYKWFSSELIKDTIYSIHHFPSKGLRGDLTYYNNKENERNLADKEIERKNNVYYWSQIKPDEINESDELQWIKDIKLELPKNENWVIINDIDQESLEVSEKIQNFLFEQGYIWLSGRQSFLANKVAAISHRKENNKFSYIPNGSSSIKEIINLYKMEMEDEVFFYYWSQLSKDDFTKTDPSSIVESNELDWMGDSNADVLQVGNILKDNTSEKGPYFIIRKIIGDTAYIEGVEEKRWKNQFYLETLMEMLDRGEIVYVGERLPINILKNIYPSYFN